MESGTGRNSATSEIKLLSTYFYRSFVFEVPWKKSFFSFSRVFFLSVCIFAKSFWFSRQISPEFGSPFSFFVYQMSNNYYYCFGSVLNADSDQPYSFESLAEPRVMFKLQNFYRYGTVHCLVHYRCSRIRVRCFCVLFLNFLWYSTWINTWFGSVVWDQMNADPYSKDQWILLTSSVYFVFECSQQAGYR